MIDIEELKPQIIERLKPLNPDKIILFGSYAYGTPREDSDIDLYVVTNDDFIPQNYKEKSEMYLKYSRAIRDLREKISVDLIVHTKKMYVRFVELNSSFYCHTIKKGVEL